MTHSCCIVSQIFIISYLTYQSCNFKTLIEKNDESSRFRSFRGFRGFALHYKSPESAESWENFEMLADKRLDYFLTGLKLISKNEWAQLLKKITTEGSHDKRTVRDWLILVAMLLRHLLLVTWRIKAVPLWL